MAHPKGLLMERLKKLAYGKPEFRTANTGPAHQPTFLSDVMVDGEVYGTGQGSTKREAERLAAEEALGYLDRNPLALAETTSGTTDSGRSATRQAASPRKGEAAGRGDRSLNERSRHDEGDEDFGALEEGRFEGPWPVFETLLATALRVANERVETRLAGEEARSAVRDFALELYKELLEDLGDVVEEDA